MHAKGELLPEIRPGGTAVLNGDDPLVRRLAERFHGRRLLFGADGEAPVRAADCRQTHRGLTFTLVVAGARVPVTLHTAGAFMCLNALAAAAVGHLAGLSAAEIGAGLADFEPVKGRLNLVSLADGTHLIDDTYNANPLSMGVALDTLAALRGGQRAFVVAGDMLELGPEAERWHRRIGERIGRMGVERLCAAGALAAAVAAGAREAGLPPDRIFTGTRQEIEADLGRRLQPGDWVLVKGSRGMAMEKVVAGLKDRAGRRAGADRPAEAEEA
jgi:UDP-N-acetylmuramoyl-tripeptide--D-alanyl-D-alanine ligase